MFTVGITCKTLVSCAMSERCSLHGPGVVISPWVVFSAWHWAALLTPQPTPFIDRSPAVTAFSVFFCDQERCSIQPVRAMDPEHAIAQRRLRCFLQQPGLPMGPPRISIAPNNPTCPRSGLQAMRVNADCAAPLGGAMVCASTKEAPGWTTRHPATRQKHADCRPLLQQSSPNRGQVVQPGMRRNSVICRLRLCA
jgi:hypothetical protein